MGRVGGHPRGDPADRGELNDLDNRRDEMRAAHRDYTWRHLKVSVTLDTRTRDRYAAAFSGAPERTSP